MTSSNTQNERLGFAPELNRETISTAIGAGQDWMRKAAIVQAEWLELCQGQTKRAIEGAQVLARCKDMNEALAVQGDLTRSMIAAYTTGTQRIAAIWTEAATDAAAAAETVAAAPYRQAAE